MKDQWKLAAIALISPAIFAGCEYLFEDRYPQNTGTYEIPEMENSLQRETDYHKATAQDPIAKMREDLPMNWDM